MTHAAAFGIGLGAGFAWSLLVFAAMLQWFERRTPGRRIAVMLSLLLVLVIGAVAMPDFKTGLVYWIAVPIGMAVSQLVTLPLGYRRGRR